MGRRGLPRPPALALTTTALVVLTSAGTAAVISTGTPGVGPGSLSAPAARPLGAGGPTVIVVPGAPGPAPRPALRAPGAARPVPAGLRLVSLLLPVDPARRSAGAVPTRQLPVGRRPPAATDLPLPAATTGVRSPSAPPAVPAPVVGAQVGGAPVLPVVPAPVVPAPVVLVVAPPAAVPPERSDLRDRSVSTPHKAASATPSSSGDDARQDAQEDPRPKAQPADGDGAQGDGASRAERHMGDARG